ncbi:MAG: rRNA maturation RNase YbeY [Candidatus Pacebacteria bacterium]|nr:rRNA maturation RNase YbeY [Candidatus Paceibacterota bacterium]
MIEIQNLNLNFKRIDRKFLIDIANTILAKEKVSKKVDISVVIVNEKDIQKMNRQYRKKNKVTDVLSFGSIKDFSSIESFVLPEIVICPDEVKRNADAVNVSFKNELVRVLIHGILHLLDYDHEKDEKDAKKMFLKQDKYLAMFFKDKKVKVK